MKTVKLLFASRSDGQLSSAPSAEQLRGIQSKTSRLWTWYSRLEDSSEESRRFRKKLGERLAARLGLKTNPGLEFMLGCLPHDYVLYERIKSPMRKGEPPDPQKKDLTRSDHFLFGYPGGETFRSAEHFAEHLYYLVTSISQDRSNCACVICSPNGSMRPARNSSQISQEPAQRPPTLSTTSISQTVQPNPSQNQTAPSTMAQPANNANVPQRSGAPSIMSSSQSHAATTHARLAPPMANHHQTTLGGISNSQTRPTAGNPTPIERHFTKEQEEDISFECWFRVGEMIWYRNSTRNGSWSLGIILGREAARMAEEFVPAMYLVQQLSYALDDSSEQVVVEETNVRAWLAISLHPEFRNAQTDGLRYDAIEWAKILGKWGVDGARVYGGNLAARRVDGTYTPFEKLDDADVEPGTLKCRGIFVGGEKFWVGDAIRLNSANNNEIMVLHSINVAVGLLRAAAQQQNNAITLVGDTYQYVYEGDQALIEPFPWAFPSAVARDSEARNEISKKAKKWGHQWQFVEKLRRINLGAARGRYYPPALMLQSFDPNKYAEGVASGDLPDVRLLQRGYWAAQNRMVGVIVGDRIGSFGRSIPMTLRLEAPLVIQSKDAADDLVSGNAAGSGDIAAAEGDEVMSEFLHLD